MGEWMVDATEHDIRAVKLKFTIDVDGTVRDIVVGVSSEDPIADALAVKCAQKWLYHPATKGGRPVELPWEATISFSTAQSSQPSSAEFDAAASNVAAQTCTNRAAPFLEQRWTNMNARYARALGKGKDFECIYSGNADRVCRAIPGSDSYPMIVTSTLYSTGRMLKVGVEIETVGDCAKIHPLKFENQIPLL